MTPNFRSMLRKCVFITGPVIGSYLYNAGGFICPFWTAGGLILALSLALHFAVPDLPKTKSKDDETGGNSDGTKPILQRKYIQMLAVGKLAKILVYSSIFPHKKSNNTA